MEEGRGPAREAVRVRMPTEHPRSTGREAGPLCLENALNAESKVRGGGRLGSERAGPAALESVLRQL